MLTFSLVLSAIILLVANLTARSPKRIVATTLLTGFGLSFGMMCISFGAILFTPILQTIFMALLFVPGALKGYSWRWFMATSLAATASAYGVTGTIAILHARQDARLRELFPYESMAARVPDPRPHPDELEMTPGSAGRLAELEERLEDRSSFRLYLLRDLHERQVELFINSPGFGAARMFRPTEERLTSEFGETASERVQPQPGRRSEAPWSPAEAGASEREELDNAHRINILTFADPRTWGLVKSRDQVAGFRPHAFRKPAVDAKKWRVASVDLISLLLHDEPVVYVSELLPRMDEVRDMPTRKLDYFEDFGLSMLRRGEDLYVGETSDGLRMLGALRAAKQCVSCHGGQRGDLLGAFSYTLRQADGDSAGRR